jgi:DNA-binding transcriptional LysR family regulator
LRISAPVVFAHVALVETAAKFARDHPLVQLEIVAEDRVVDLLEEQYDLVIRIAPSEDEPLVGRRITSDRQLLVAAPALARPPYRRSEDEQEVAAVLRSSARAPAGWRVRDAKGRLLRLKPRPVMQLSSLLMVRDAVIGGAGAALLPSLLVRSDVLSGRLVCWGVDENPPIDIWALQSSHRLIGAKVKAFLDALVEAQSPSTKA